MWPAPQKLSPSTCVAAGIHAEHTTLLGPIKEYLTQETDKANIPFTGAVQPAKEQREALIRAEQVGTVRTTLAATALLMRRPIPTLAQPLCMAQTLFALCLSWLGSQSIICQPCASKLCPELSQSHLAELRMDRCFLLLLALPAACLLCCLAVA